MKLLLGCDPEVFVKLKGRKKFHSAHGLINGTKKEPEKCEKGALQVDGMALEFNIDPASSGEEFLGNIKTVLAQMQARVPEFDIIKEPVANFSAAVMKAQPPEAVELGCEPDYNAWKGGGVNPRPNAKVNFRTGAGHIHFGWTENAPVESHEHINACNILIQALDQTLGVACTIFDEGSKRRELYGSAGAFRPKSYGCEYRVPSNAWLKDDATILWVYEICNTIFKRLHNGTFMGCGLMSSAMVFSILKSPKLEDYMASAINDMLGTQKLPPPPGYKFNGKRWEKKDV